MGSRWDAVSSSSCTSGKAPHSQSLSKHTILLLERFEN